MQVSNFVLFGVIEAYVVLVVVSIFLLMHSRGLKTLIFKLQKKLEELVKDLRKTRAAHKALQAELDPVNAYKKQISDQLLITRKYHESLDPGQDIALDLSPDTPIKRQTAAFRHALLIAEKEALHTNDDEKPNWDTLEQRMTQLIQFYQGAGAPKDNTGNLAAVAQLDAMQAELDNSKKRIENLEKFKTLFFNMESQWQEAKSQAQEYYEQLSAMAGNMSDQGSYKDILERYNQVYDQVGSMIEFDGEGGDRSKDTAAIEAEMKTRTSTVEIVKKDNRALCELRELRSVAAEQHRVINELQRRLSQSTSAEEKNNLIAELNVQLQQQARFLQESEVCMQQLEGELSRSMQQVSDLESKLKAVGRDIDHIPNMKSVIQTLTEESKEMQNSLARLEQENEQLVAQVQQVGEIGGTIQLEETKKELLALQTQHAELEERYLELRVHA